MHKSQVLAIVTETSAPKLMDWLVLKNGCADLMGPWALGSTQ